MFNMMLGVKMPVMNWTSETGPIKQGGAIVVSMFGGWGICIAMGGLYLLIGYRIGAVPYLLLCSLLLGAAALFLLRWLDTKGADSFAAL
jgi:ABC-2 type transport system permease protein